MSKPKAYAPERGYKWQILCRNPQYGRAWEHCDYAADIADLRNLLAEYRLAYGAGWHFKAYKMPAHCWPAHCAQV